MALARQILEAETPKGMFRAIQSGPPRPGDRIQSVRIKNRSYWNRTMGHTTRSVAIYLNGQLVHTAVDVEGPWFYAWAWLKTQGYAKPGEDPSDFRKRHGLTLLIEDPVRVRTKKELVFTK